MKTHGSTGCNAHLGGNELEATPLAVLFLFDEIGDIGVGVGKRHIAHGEHRVRHDDLRMREKLRPFYENSKSWCAEVFPYATNIQTPDSQTKSLLNQMKFCFFFQFHVYTEDWGLP